VQFKFHGQRIEINVPTRAALEVEVRQRFASGQGFTLATINMDHLVKMAASPRFLDAYAQQDLVVADGHPIVWLSRLAHQPVELMPGSNLVLPLCQLAAQAKVRVALVGSTQVALDDAARILHGQVAGLDITLRLAPSGVFDPMGDEAAQILQQLNGDGIGLCFLALGAPKQEIFAAHGRQLSPGVGFASIGAGLDFLGGHQHRAPLWMRRMALEWLWRILSSPVRMVPRYARCFAILPGQIRQAWLQR
jgi:N-acetylglucosaminyldiphosphoundecaprenol N-acetyl-beta-D-mannosaminyltransferase